ncbi:alpha-ketoacid dehydrogenase kinase [Violaceomyces palustris]|uniref:Alpha-ketoacid dehydrogenase kinase n=1 Tax=Violaceomyces palustris TaxID=1673888 RepID=A0ACD0P3J7_9BASI|nr:alpha-ketoacid dehydrogenase kinase [Violaceomyces palustris]
MIRSRCHRKDIIAARTHLAHKFGEPALSPQVHLFIRNHAPATPTRCISTSEPVRKRYFPPPEPFHSKSSSFSPPPSSFSTFGASPDLLSHYLALEPAPLTLRQLLAQGGQPGVAPSPEQLLRSAQHTQRELPIRLARRVGGFRALPFIVGSNPFVSKIARLYASSFDTIAKFKPIETQEDNRHFTEVLEELVSAHSQNVPTLARGFQESRKYMDPRDVAAFLDATIHSRIAIRLIAEQHLALSHGGDSHHLSGRIENREEESHRQQDRDGEALEKFHVYSSPTSVGIIETQLSPARMTKMCANFVKDLCEGTLGLAPALVLEGDVQATYAGIPVHLEYVMTELLKNSYRATTEQYFRKSKNEGGGSYGRDGKGIPPVIVTIAQSSKHISLRIRDQGGGISPQNLPHIFSYAFTTAGSEDSDYPDLESQAEVDGGGPYAMQAVGGTGGDALAEMGKMGLASGLGTLAGLGYGLPMSRIYATASGGGSSLDIVSLYGHGCDTFVKLPKSIVTSDTII